MQTLTISASVRPGRVAVVCDIADPEWMRSCRHILEIFSSVWGGHGNIIIPTDGNTIQPLFWEILEKFDPDYIYEYRPTLRDLEERDPQAFEGKLAEQLDSWGEGVEPTQDMIDRARANLRSAHTNAFTISAQLAQQLKTRVAPFFYEDYVVQPGFWRAGEIPEYPHTRVLDLLQEADHPDKIILPARSLDASESLWYSGAIGSCSEEFANSLDNAGIKPVPVGDGTGTEDPIEEQRKLISFVVDRGSLERSAGLHVMQPNSPLPQTIRFTPSDLSLLNLGWFKSRRSKLWAPKALAIAGNTVSDFCLYLALSRLRERVFWIFPPITEAALNGMSPQYRYSPSATFANAVRMVTEYVQQHAAGLDMTSATLNATQLGAVKVEIGLAARSAFHADIQVEVTDAIPDHPLRFFDRSNALKQRVVQLPDSRVIELFETPKPTSFRRINPSVHRWITELELQSQQPPRHPGLGAWFISGTNQSSNEARTSASGLAYFCPSSIILPGQDIDAITVRPNVRVPAAREIFEKVADFAGLVCTTSDKGFYAQDAVEKLGGLEKASQFLRSASGRALIEAYLDKTPNREGQHNKGVFLAERRFLCAADLCKVLKSASEVISYIDDFARRGILLRGFIFQCQFCRYAAWFPLKEIGDQFTCPRCHREQIFTSLHWKAPRCQPSLYYQLDEIVYQGLGNNMQVPILTLDCLRRSSQSSFLYVEELAFRRPNEPKPFIECDVNCVVDGVLTIGEAKIANRLDQNRGREAAIVEGYRSLAASIGARRVVFATRARAWDGATVKKIQQVLGNDSLDVRLLTDGDLMKE
jgi:hypothetical protein